MVVAREPGVAPISELKKGTERAANLIQLTGVATAFDPFAGNVHVQRIDADLQPTATGQESADFAKVPRGYVEVTIWRGKRPTTYQVRNHQ